MAYFLAEPGPRPEDVAVVVTEPGKAALWVNSVTSALFTNTGVTFTATIGPKVADGEWAGTGENGYGNFNCWQRYVPRLYTYESTSCSQVYACNHDEAPANATLPNLDAQNSAADGGGMAKGTIIGIVVGVVGGLLFLAAAALVFWFWRRSRNGQSTTAPSASHPSSGGWATPKPFLPVMPVLGETQQAPAVRQMSAVYGVDGHRFRVEMANDHGKFEMDGEPSTGKSGKGGTNAGMVAAEVLPVSPPMSSVTQTESPPGDGEQLPKYRE